MNFPNLSHLVIRQNYAIISRPYVPYDAAAISNSQRNYSQHTTQGTSSIVTRCYTSETSRYSCARQQILASFLAVMTYSNENRLMWICRLAWMDHFTGLHLLKIYQQADPPPHCQAMTIQRRPVYSNEQSIISDVLLHALVRYNFLTPLWMEIANRSQYHKDALNTISSISTVKHAQDQLSTEQDI